MTFIFLICAMFSQGCAKKSVDKTQDAETSLYGMSYYRGIDFPAEYVFISILNPKHQKITSIKFLNEPQAQIGKRPAYGPQVEKNLSTWGISASRFMSHDSAAIREELLRDITSNTVEIIYGDSVRQTLTIKEVPHFKYIEKYRQDTTAVTFWANPFPN